jgi:predicted dehydrogenase
MIRIGIVGCGRILAAHLRGYRLLRELGFDDFRITALCSRKEADAAGYLHRGSGPPQRRPVSDIPGDPLAVGNEYLSDFQDTQDVRTFTDYRRMIAETPLDAINDFSTHGLHHQIAKSAFDAGKHLLTQKPLAVTIKAARRVCEQAERAGLVFGVFENARFRPGTRHLHWLFHGGPGGKLQMVFSGNVARWWAPNRIVAETPWRHKLLEAGGITLDLGVHQFNVIRHLAGEVKTILGRTCVIEKQRITVNPGGKEIESMDCDADDTCLASFETEEGVQGSLTASWAGHGGVTMIGPGMVFHGTGGRAAGDDLTDDNGITRGIGSLYRDQAGEQTRQSDFPIATEDGFALTQHDWLEAIRRNRQPEIDGWEGLKDLACAYAVLESSLAGKRMVVQDVLEGRIEDYQRPLNEHFEIPGTV